MNKKTPKVLVVVEDGIASLYVRGVKEENAAIIDLDEQDEEAEQEAYLRFSNDFEEAFPEAGIHFDTEKMEQYEKQETNS